MTGHTHFIGGIASLVFPGAILIVAGVPFTREVVGIAAFAAIFGALLPDIDANASKIKGFTLDLNTAPGRSKAANRWTIQPFALPAQALHSLLGHRTLTHSLLGLALATVLIAVPLGFFSPSASLGLVFGYASHLLLDSATPHGVPLLYPDKRLFHCLPKPLRVATLSANENLVFAVLSIPAFLVVLFAIAVTVG